MPMRLAVDPLCEMNDMATRTEYAVKVNRQEYYALVSHMDAQIGRILDAVDRSGKADSTYIIFTADHGLAVGHHGFMGKQNLYEAQHQGSLPDLWSDIKKNHVMSPSTCKDVMPTTLHLAGLPLADSIEFKSLLPLLSASTATHYPSIYGGFKGIQRSMPSKIGNSFTTHMRISTVYIT